MAFSKNNLAQRYLRDISQSIIYFEMHQFHKTADFVSGLYRYLDNIDKSYETLKRAKNPLGCIHFVRMAADACCYAYGLLMAIDDTHRKNYIEHILSGKPLRNLKTGLTFVDQDGKKKHQKYTTNFLAKEITKNLMPNFMDVYDTSNNYIHPSGFYFKEFLVNSVKQYENANIANPLEADINLVLFNNDVVKSFHNLMHELNQLFAQIITYIMGTYELEFLMERYKKSPQTLSCEGGIKEYENGEVENMCTPYNEDVIWELIVKSESDPDGMINQLRELIADGTLNKWDLVAIDAALRVKIYKEKHKRSFTSFG